MTFEEFWENLKSSGTVPHVWSNGDAAAQAAWDHQQQRIDELERFIKENYTCPEAYGLEGPETFPDCGNCVYCQLFTATQEQD